MARAELLSDEEMRFEKGILEVKLVRNRWQAAQCQLMDEGDKILGKLREERILVEGTLRQMRWGGVMAEEMRHKNF